VKITKTTTIDRDESGEIIREVEVTEELPGGDFLDISGLSDNQIGILANIRDAYRIKADR
jgi:hypothetical protein